MLSDGRQEDPLIGTCACAFARVYASAARKHRTVWEGASSAPLNRFKLKMPEESGPVH